MADAPHLPSDPADPADVRALLPADVLPAATPFVTLDALRAALAARIADLLNRQPDLLMSLLYRIDVAEAAVQAAFASTPPGHLPQALADLVIERQLQKLRWRRHYGRDPARNPDPNAPF